MDRLTGLAIVISVDETLCEVTANYDGVNERGAVELYRRETPREEHGPDQTVVRQHGEQRREQLFGQQNRDERQPVGEPFDGRLHDVRAANGLGPPRRRPQHDLDGGVRGIGERDKVAQQH